MYQYPYGDTQQLNLDWILTTIKELEAGSGNIDMEEVANALISATYNSATQYRRYDYCYLNGKLYRCLSDTTGAFNPADWQEVLIGDDIPILTRLINAVDASLTSLQTTVNDLDSDDIDNASSVTGTTVSDALENINSTLTPFKQMFNSPTWEIGSISTASGAETAATNQIRSNYIRCNTGTRINCASNFQFIVCKYNIDTMAYDSASGSWQSTEYTIGSACWCRILVRKTDQSTITDAALVSEYVYIGDYELHNSTEAGSDSNGNYIKFGDGTLIQFGTKLPVVDMTHAWGALYYGEAPSTTFPVPFIERPCVAIGVGNGQSAIVMSCNPSTTGISNLQFCRGTASNGTVIYDWLAMGKWK